MAFKIPSQQFQINISVIHRYSAVKMSHLLCRRKSQNTIVNYTAPNIMEPDRDVSVSAVATFAPLNEWNI